MAVSNISNSVNTSTLYNYSNSINSDDTSSQIISSISNVDSYVQSQLENQDLGSKIMYTNPYNVSNIQSAMTALNNSIDIRSVDNVDSYVRDVLNLSQNSELNDLSSDASGIDLLSSIDNVDSSVISSIESYKLGINGQTYNMNAIGNVGNYVENALTAYNTIQKLKDDESTSSVNTVA